ncbi:uncharacterized protein LOC105832472 [Monomorium pharaonis]|uniref:uncharacterized protein LOC105832472 n=1 Tax=Monomorium pharaonis TaxID=307658 RepID=UPI00063F7B5E|nr:uncharacterized protein LOC105832472 [Monomorium pharaonis]XP_012528897.1 uncharacterized protein LOC105832472 [Monomorium pharaonis]
MSTPETEICGFLDVKSMGSRYIAQKVRKKGLALLRIWKRSWCSVKKLEPGLGVQIQFDEKLSCRSSTLKQKEKDNSVVIPPNATIYRICSRTKQFAFSISLAVDRKPILSLSGNSETETQRWMANIRHLLKPRKYSCTERSYEVSIIDNAHSKAAGLTGLYGDLIANEKEIFIRDVHTGKIVKSFEWKEFTQFHLMSVGRPEDVKRICVIHTSKEFCCDVGELYIFCLNANKLLQDLVTQGRGPKHRQKSSHFNTKNLEVMGYDGINLSLQLKNEKEESHCTLDTDANQESNMSIASGIYEEIVDDICSSKLKTSFTSNKCKDKTKIQYNLEIEPPALPPRQKQRSECVKEDRMDMEQHSHPEAFNHFETRLQNIIYSTQETIFTDHSSYVPMSPQLRDLHMLESDVLENLKENDYVIMR